MDEVSERGVGDGEENQSYDGTNLQTMAASFVNTCSLDDNTNQTSQTVTKSKKGNKVKKFEPNESYLETLIGMGFNRQLAIKALYLTSNNSVELATSWLLENPHTDLDFDYDQIDTLCTSSQLNDIYKMVFIVNSSLEMGIGKTAAQVAHSAIGMHMLLLQDEPKYGEAIMKWFEYGETKIVLKGDSTSHLIQLEKKALSLGLPTYLVQDAGKTQVPVGSITALCIFGLVDKVDRVSGSLRLL